MKKSKDFAIFKIRYYADEKLLKKARLTGDNLPMQHHERAKLYNEFFWKFIEIVTNKSSDIWHCEYMFGSRDCAEEELSDYGIYISDKEGWFVYLIPVERQDIIDWVSDNVTIPMKRLKKYSMYSPNVLGHRTWQREYAKEYMSKNNLLTEVGT